jgi:hypothetical protein
VKKIDSLVADIYETLKNGIDLSDRPELVDKYSNQFKELLTTRLAKREPRKGTLRMSSIGQPCERKLYYEVNSPEDAEELRPEVYMKFLFGDLTELLLLFLAEASGHTVEGTQDEQDIVGIKGHRDAVIDGTLVDVKSASTYSFKKFAEGKLAEDDPFGYVIQLQSYLHAGQTDDKVKDKSRAAFLVVDKTLGHICTDFHEYQKLPMEAIYERKKDLVSSDELPIRRFTPVPEGKSGNEKIPMNCSYCPFKKKCYDNLRTFLYSTGPVHLSKVVKEPNVPEIT